MLLIKAHELCPLPSPFLSFPAVLPLLRMQLPRNPWVTLHKGVSSLVYANNTAEKNNKCRTICLMKSLTFYFISPYCISKEVNRKTFANNTTVYWLLGWLLSYLFKVLACCAVPASAFSFLLWQEEHNRSHGCSPRFLSPSPLSSSQRGGNVLLLCRLETWER